METMESQPDLTGLPVIDSWGEEIGKAQRVRPDFFFTGDEPDSLVVYRSQIERVEDGVIRLNVKVEQLRRTGVNPARVGPQIVRQSIDYRAIRAGFSVFGKDGTLVGRVTQDDAVYRIYFKRGRQHYGVPAKFIDAVDVRERSVWLSLTTEEVVKNVDFEVGS